MENTLCPFCHNANGCQAHQASCWCFQADIPAELLALVPEEHKFKSCICKQCISAFQKDPEKFKASHA